MSRYALNPTPLEIRILWLNWAATVMGGRDAAVPALRYLFWDRKVGLYWTCAEDLPGLPSIGKLFT
jgi:hypothetical protein